MLVKPCPAGQANKLTNGKGHVYVHGNEKAAWTGETATHRYGGAAQPAQANHPENSNSPTHALTPPMEYAEP